MTFTKKYEDLKPGDKFGRWTVLSESDKRCHHKCICECGTIKDVADTHLRKGTSQSCGCLHRDNVTKYSVPGGSNSRIYDIWNGIKSRCYNPKNKSYEHYGGAGIKMCDDWCNNYEAFWIWAINNGYDDSLTIDRVDCKGDYCPENCRWVDWITQENNRSFNHMIEYDGKTHSLSEWSRLLGFEYDFIKRRLAYGFTFEEALAVPKGMSRMTYYSLND